MVSYVALQDHIYVAQEIVEQRVFIDKPVTSLFAAQVPGDATCLDEHRTEQPHRRFQDPQGKANTGFLPSARGSVRKLKFELPTDSAHLRLRLAPRESPGA